MNPDPGDLSRLHDLAVPPPAPFWPPAPGWYVLAALVLVVAGLGVWMLTSWWQRNRYRREALAEVDRLETLAADAAHRHGALEQLAAVVRRTALTAYGREAVAPLLGQAWLDFLDDTATAVAFSTTGGAPLVAAAYDPVLADRLDANQRTNLFSRVRLWVRHHRARSPC